MKDIYERVAELADALGLGPSGETLGGSTPLSLNLSGRHIFSIPLTGTESDSVVVLEAKQ
jgi:hypothetical protein